VGFSLALSIKEQRISLMLAQIEATIQANSSGFSYGDTNGTSRGGSSCWPYRGVKPFHPSPGQPLRKQTQTSLSFYDNGRYHQKGALREKVKRAERWAFGSAKPLDPRRRL
jgi:hypothetical protein